jgi:hypothetical protein
VFEQREVKFIDDMVWSVVFRLVSEAGRTVVADWVQQFGSFADVTLAVVTLDFVGRIHDVLNGDMRT